METIDGLVVELWNQENEKLALEFLNANLATSLFLLSNLKQHGPTLSAHSNSGQFRVIRDDAGAVIGVFVLARRGNILVSGQPPASVYPLMLNALLADGIKPSGVLGRLEFSEGLFNFLRAAGVLEKSTFESREVLYELDPLPEYKRDARSRFLKTIDFPNWRPLRSAYETELGLKNTLSEEQVRSNFSMFCDLDEWWGLFEGDDLVAIAALNARAHEIGQVGGVYTVPSRRGQGLSKAIMRSLLSDCRDLHGLNRMTLFTGEKNFSAQAVYEGLGFKRIGRFGIFFG